MDRIKLSIEHLETGGVAKPSQSFHTAWFNNTLEIKCDDKVCRIRDKRTKRVVAEFKLVQRGD